MVKCTIDKRNFQLEQEIIAGFKRMQGVHESNPYTIKKLVIILRDQEKRISQLEELCATLEVDH